MMMSTSPYSCERESAKGCRDKRTHFIPHILISQGRRSGLAEQDYPPLPSLSQLEALVMDLMRQFTSRREYEGTGAGTEILLPF